MKGTAKGIHLTNDAVQKHIKHYGEHEPNNKLSFQELDKYMLNNETFSLYKDVLPQMKTIARDTCQAVGERLGGKSDAQAIFQRIANSGGFYAQRASARLGTH